MQGFEDLSLEVREHILSYCCHSDLLQARLGNKALAAACNALVFKQISICCFAFSLERLKNLAKSSLARHVKTLTVYTTSWRKTLRTRSDFRQLMSYAYPDEVDVAYSNDGVSAKQWEIAHSSYKTLHSQQANFINQVNRGALQSILAKLPALCEVSISSSDGASFPAPSQAPWNRLSLNLVRDITCFQREIERDLDDWITGQILHALAIRVREPLSPILSLSIENWLGGEFLSRPHRGYLSDIRGPALEEMLANLTTLRIRDCGEKRLSSIPNMFYLLQHTKKLRYLTLIYNDMFSHPEPDLRKRTPLSPLFGDGSGRWRDLKSLRMSVDVMSQDMIRFMEEARYSLKYLAIRNCSMDNVPAVLDRIPKFLDLSQIHLSNLHSWDTDDRTSSDWTHYICNGRMKAAERAWLLTGDGPTPKWKRLEAVEEEREQGSDIGDHDAATTYSSDWSTRYDDSADSREFRS